jgi:hypothetical protein
VLKNRAIDRVIFVVLFTLYLKEDIDEKGNPKEGVETGKPFHLMDGADREKYEKRKNGDGADDDEEDEKVDEIKKSSANGGDFYDDSDDGVD